MTYIIQKTDGTILTTILDGSTNKDTGLTLIGRNFTNYGDYQNENFIRLLENFASPLPPGQSVGFTPIAGQLWWDTANRRLRVFNGTEFVNVSERTASSTAPAGSSVKLGDQWYDTTNRQLKVWNSTEWMLISPLYTYAQGKSGATIETVTDLSAVTHTVVNTYTNGNLISVTSFDPTFVTAAYNNFDYIHPGINLASNVMLNGNVTNSVKLGSIFANAYARVDINSTFTKDISIVGNLILTTNANISYSGSNLSVKNNQLSGNINLKVVTPLGEVTGVKIIGSSGLVTVAGNPTSALGIATKDYVDTIVNSLTNNYTNSDSTLTNAIATLRTDTGNYTTANMIAQTANLVAVQSAIDANVSALSNSADARFTTANANSAIQATSISTINDRLPLLANIASPVFTGHPEAPQAAALTTYLNTYSMMTSALLLDDIITVTAGDYITQHEVSGDEELANVKVINSTTSANIIVQHLNGTVTMANTTTIVKVNNTLQSGVHTINLIQFGPDPVFTGLGDLSTRLATTKYVDVTANLVYGDYNGKINNEISARTSAISNAVSLLATKASPTLTGVPVAPTPTMGDNSTQIATTAFVGAAIQAQQFNYTVSASGPTGGTDGDFWFQIS